MNANFPSLMTFKCIICRLVQPRSAGRPVSDDRFPSWRCADTDACAARFLAGAQT